MKQVLKKLFLGDIVPETQFRPKTVEYTALRQKYCKLDQAFIEKLRELGPEWKVQYDAVWEKYYDLQDIETEEMFYQAFSLGMKLMKEVMETKPAYE